jgi:hypothetical protein
LFSGPEFCLMGSRIYVLCESWGSHCGE